MITLVKLYGIKKAHGVKSSAAIAPVLPALPVRQGTCRPTVLSASSCSYHPLLIVQLLSLAQQIISNT